MGKEDGLSPEKVDLIQSEVSTFGALQIEGIRFKAVQARTSLHRIAEGANPADQMPVFDLEYVISLSLVFLMNFEQTYGPLDAASLKLIARVFEQKMVPGPASTDWMIVSQAFFKAYNVFQSQKEYRSIDS